MTRWIGFLHDRTRGFGRLDGESIAVFEGDLFGAKAPTGQVLPLSEVAIDLPCRPSKMIALWNNLGALAEKQGLDRPEAPLFLIKPPNTYRPSGAAVSVPEASGRALHEGELGIVVGGMSLEPGDVIACGTSVGSGPIPKGATVEVVIDGIGTLANRFE